MLLPFSPLGWLGSIVVSALDSGAECPGSNRSRDSLRQTVHAHCASVHQTAKLVAALLRVAGVTAGLAESSGSLPPGDVTCRLTAKNRDQLRNPTLGNRVWATFLTVFSVNKDLYIQLALGLYLLLPWRL